MKKPIRRNVAALIGFINSRQNTPHAWGRRKNDCMSFAGKAVEALTDGKVKPLKGLQWSNEETGRKLLNGLGGVEAALDARFERIHPSKAMRGDIAGVPDPDLGIHPMIIEGEALVCPGEKGNRRCRRKHMIAAWSVA